MKHTALSLILLLFGFSILAQEVKVFTDQRDNTQYNYVTIGNQVWMAENLNRGTILSCLYNDTYYPKLGCLYTYFDAQSVCPVGWHLPSDKEWQTLIDYLGGSEIAGIKLKSKTAWSNSTMINTNESGFSSVPGGYRYDWNDPQLDKFKFMGIANYAGYWTSTPDVEVKGYARSLLNENNTVKRESRERRTYLSVRCVKD